MAIHPSSVSLLALFSFFLSALPAHSATYFIDGKMASTIELKITERITFPKGVSSFHYQVAKPSSHTSKTFSQSIEQFSLFSTPQPSKRSENKDRYGNRILINKWMRPSGKIEIVTRFKVENEVDLRPIVSTAPFPPTPIPDQEKLYLKSTKMVQSDHPKIRQMAEKLTRGAKGELEAVSQSLNWIVDHLTYTLQPQRYDALYSFQSGRGNCQNFSHLSAALLRAVGIPTRIITGITLKKPWRVRSKKRTWTLNLATGHHAWIEVYYPDLGWVQYDAQQTHHFVSTRYLRLETGIDTRSASADGYARWKSPPRVSPKLDEVIEARFLADKNTVRSSDRFPNPKNNLFSLLIRFGKGLAPAIPKPSPLHETTKPPTADMPPIDQIVKLPFKIPVEFGNLDFPKIIDIFADAGKAIEGEAKKNFVVESAEYVTSKELYAQAFRVETPLKLKDISLAFHKFGGTSGALWIELLEGKDDQIVPSGAKSLPLKVKEIRYFPGYKWIPFTFPKGIILLPDRYWIVLRYSGDPIFNWFYIFGNPFGDPDDTLSKPLKKKEWLNQMNFDFNFRVRGYQPKF